MIFKLVLSGNGNLDRHSTGQGLKHIARAGRTEEMCGHTSGGGIRRWNI